ncbi:hypothetical protein HZC00_05360 [Candidatus Kaiserbacteria bacterium]|nr:hypothetical protein [Candidatus Kaiserbacteria bacterium]
MKTRTIEDIEKDKLEAKLEDSIFLRVIDHGLGYPDGFSYTELVDGLELEGWERKIVDEYLEIAYKNAYNAGIHGIRGSAHSPFFLVREGATGGFMHQDHKYIMSFDAHFKFIDYHELKFARENAKEAKHLAVIAIAVSIGAALAAIVMPVVVAQMLTQTVRIDETQLKSLQSTSTVLTDISSNPTQ